MEKLYNEFLNLKTPCYVVDENLLIKNLEKLEYVSKRASCKILLAQKAFSMYSTYTLQAKYLHGTTASGLFEAKLGFEEMGGECHVFSAAYLEHEMDEILKICDHITFNSFNQWEKYKEKCLKSGKSFGIRINPEHSTQDHAIYDPCAKGSRMGVTIDNFKAQLLYGIDGLHFHTLCEQNSDALIETLKEVEHKFGKYLHQMKWVNFGGGHHITREDYDVEALISCIIDFKNRYNVEVYLEPGEAVALNAGFLMTEVLDIVENSIKIAILDTSAACHMPDVIEMPYTPPLFNAEAVKNNDKSNGFTYRLAGPTCLAGDIIGDYNFKNDIKIGDKLMFCDMAIYSMVKNNTFNGMCLPNIYLKGKNGITKLIKSFGYDDFKSRL